MITASDVLVIMRNNGEHSLHDIPKEPMVIYKNNDQVLSYVSIRADNAKLIPLVADACEPTGWNYKNIRQYHPSGGFILNGVKINSKYDYSWTTTEKLWNNHHPLEICLFLSWVVHPTPTGLKYVARCFFQDEKLISIAPHEYSSGWATSAFLPMPSEEIANQRSWFTQEESALLGQIIDSFLDNKLPERLFGLLWFYVVAFSMNIRTMRWHFLSQSLHSAVCTNGDKVRQQFITRLLPLAADVGIALDKKEAQQLWDYRNKTAHAHQLKEITPEEVLLMQKAENIIKSSIVNGLLNSGFASRWGSTDNIRQQWPT